jgi:AcrR family transcriptional regulator
MLHQQGVEKTTIADIATAADVPVGNVYYYFKTKDQLIDAAIEAHTHDVETMLTELGRHRTPRARLKAFVRAFAGQVDLVARYGCPLGTLCSELDKRDDTLDRDAASLFTLLIDWSEQQFGEMGARDPRDLAVALVAAYEGAALLTNTFRDPDLMRREARRLDRWIDSLV